MELSYLIGDVRLERSIHHDLWQLVSSHQRDKDHQQTAVKFRAARRYVARLIEWTTSGYAAVEPLPTNHGQKAMGEELRESVRALALKKIERHVCALEREIASLRSAQSSQSDASSAEEILSVINS